MIVIRILAFGVVVTGALFLPFWYFVPLACVYAFVFSPYELLILGVLIDAEFGDPSLGMSYRYTLAITCIVLASFFLKPYIRFYRN